MMPHMLMHLQEELRLSVVGRNSTHTSGKYFPRNIHVEKPTEKNSLNFCVKIHNYPVVWFIVDETHKMQFDLLLYHPPKIKHVI